MEENLKTTTGFMFPRGDLTVMNAAELYEYQQFIELQINRWAGVAEKSAFGPVKHNAEQHMEVFTDEAKRIVRYICSLFDNVVSINTRKVRR